MAAPAPVEPNLLICAQYSIWLPKSKQDLKAYNEFFIPQYVIDRAEAGKERMLFNLPGELTGGKPVPVELTVVSQAGDKRKFEGPAGKAECTGPWLKMSCNFRFNPLEIDPNEVFRNLTQLHGETPKRDAIFKIAARFGGEPIGVAVMVPDDPRCTKN